MRGESAVGVAPRHPPLPRLGLRGVTSPVMRLAPRNAWIPTRPWARILDRYRKSDNEPMVELVSHIIAAPYASLLFGFTSMSDLLVSQFSTAEWGHDLLRVGRDEHVVRFSFHEQPRGKPATWECSPGRIVESFEGFLRKMKWVSF
jgi:hypothetical protein